MDDRPLFELEQLRNLNRFYFQPILDETIPYHNTVKRDVEARREDLHFLMKEWDHLRESQNGDDTKSNAGS